MSIFFEEFFSGERFLLEPLLSGSLFRDAERERGAEEKKVIFDSSWAPLDAAYKTYGLPQPSLS